MGGAEGHHSKQNKSDKGRKPHHLFSHMWNLDFIICLCKVTFNMEHNIESLGDLIITPSPLKTPTFTRFSYFIWLNWQNKRKRIESIVRPWHAVSHVKRYRLVLCSWVRPPNCWLGLSWKPIGWTMVHTCFPSICMVPFLEKHARTQKVRVNCKL